MARPTVPDPSSIILGRVEPDLGEIDLEVGEQVEGEELVVGGRRVEDVLAAVQPEDRGRR
ncbi:MAG: hypothetical protein ABEL76_12090 [Bradymonadaceae bacterium]